MMTEPIEGALPPPPELPPELAAALQNALTLSLDSLDSLRINLREHVHRQRRRGASLGEIDAQMRRMMAQSGLDNAGDGAAASKDLSAQVVKWTRSFFNGTPS